MIFCPYCGGENIEGDDDCAQCGQPLDDTYLTPPNSEVERSLLRDRISVLAPKRPIAAAPMTPVGDVLRLMVERRIGCVVVVDGNQPVGIFSERDALRKINVAAADLAARPVYEFMTPNPQTLVADAKIAFAVQRMDLGEYRHLPIVGEGGELVGIISARDILRHLTDNLARGG
ncbi:MAG: CBS domain-containing protein [Planctomycetia bacterium]|nr:CBS domain-containing protein [Planctomycetia bacterium]